MLNPCSLCSAKCCKNYIITVTSFDILRVLQNRNKKEGEFVELHEARLLNFDTDTLLEFSDHPRSHVLGFKSNPCFFLDEHNRCTIHEFAPLTCRRYPFNIYSQMKGRYCPLPSSLLFKLKGPTVSSKQVLEELDSYKEIVTAPSTKVLGFLVH